MYRKNIILNNWGKLIASSMLTAIICSILALSLKHFTEFFEETVFHFVEQRNTWLFILLPTIGTTAIYFLRKYLFQGRKNKGITEIYKTLYARREHLPLFKVASHYINGFLTVVFGGSTGVEVSTVVASATVGNAMYQRKIAAKKYKIELICAAVTAGVGVLFVNPMVGFLFSMEVIHRGWTKTKIIACSIAAVVSLCIILLFKEQSMFQVAVNHWSYKAIPFMLLLSILAAFLAVYFTFMAIKVKSFFGNINNNFVRVNLGAITVGLFIFAIPALYGDSYHGLKEVLHAGTISWGMLILVVLLKPIAASLTLGAGGDGGVFAPSIVAGGFLGLMVCYLGNTFFGLDLVPINFLVIGAAVSLSAAIFAPWTAAILACSLAPNAFVLIGPLVICCFISWQLAKKILPYNVYTYEFHR